ncbi:MAG: bifunctional 5,10-methylenetetrahydrofolate dehydrogenase/5,10-methenyltetrahydrofolate cyclohydrolase [Pseudomonadota bacterium]|nr:bifunctional 5,10-methylenetetrahydrofolate dehydrogenase/5,10-methenyltetrahydrofolate cyclohydrolase [Pseudomonadota bacterium]
MEIIDGKACSLSLLNQLKPIITLFQKKHSRKPSLKIIRVSDDFASIIYTENKIKVAESIGISAEIVVLPKDIKSEELTKVIMSLNEDDQTDGIIMQLPLPGHLSKERLLNEISPEKDVDGITALNMGSLIQGSPLFVPCTPQGIMRLIKHIGLDLKGLNAVILGQSLIVGRPVAMCLLNSGATVTICHRATKDLEAKIKSADVLVSAMGAPGVVSAQWIKPGATVFDVGINRSEANKIIGDIEYDQCKHVGFITPVPGGIGPMTVACLQFNTVLAALTRVNDKTLLDELSLI